jgi:hypothetical protein
MNNHLLIIMLFAFIVVFIIGSVLEPSLSERQEAESLKLSNCVELANQIGIDPNDEDRSSFIKECYTGN